MIGEGTLKYGVVNRHHVHNYSQTVVKYMYRASFYWEAVRNQDLGLAGGMPCKHVAQTCIDARQLG